MIDLQKNIKNIKTNYSKDNNFDKILYSKMTQYITDKNSLTKNYYIG